MVTAEPRALLSPQELAEQGPPEAVRLPVDLVDASAQNPRRSLTEIEELAESIADPRYGLLQPILVRRRGERYEVLAGHRRLAAFQLLRQREPHNPAWGAIPSVVRSMDDDQDAYIALLLAQVQIRPWSVREEAAALETLAVDHTLAQIGELVHRGAPWVSRRLRAYSDAVLAGFVLSGRLSTTVAEELLIVKDAAARRELAERASAEQWGQAEARAEVRKLKMSKLVREIARRSRELLDVLSSIDPAQLPTSATRDLWALHGRIEQLATGKAPVFPSMDAARKAAHLSDKPVKQQRTRLRIE